MSSPSECRFSESHEWYTVDGDVVNLEELIEQFVEDGARSAQGRN